MSLKIALVCGHFLPEMGYLEVHLAKALSKLGHQLHVFTSDQIPAYVRAYAEGKTQPGTAQIDELYSLTRLKANFSVGQMVKCKGLAKAVQDFAPDITIVIGLGKLFPKPVFGKNVGRLIVLLGDNEDTYDQSIKKKLMGTLKNPVYKKAIQHADKICSYTPSTAEIVKGLIPTSLHQVLDQKNNQISLGFDPEHFYYNEAFRMKKRDSLEVADDVPLLITATRVTPFKGLERIIDAVDALNSEGIKLQYLIVGFSDDEYSKTVQRKMKSTANPDMFIDAPFVKTSELLAFYNAADLGLWPNPAISIFEALGTGLPLMLPTKNSVSHILQSEEDGLYVDMDSSELKAKLKQLVTIATHGQRNRKAQAEKQKARFAYQQIAQQIIAD